MDSKALPSYTLVSQQVEEAPPSRLYGVAFALLAVLTSVGSSASGRFVGSSHFTPYFVNLVRSVGGAFVMIVVLFWKNRSLTEYFPRWYFWGFVWGVGMWFTMWGMTRSLMLLDLATWTGLTNCCNQIFITAASASFLGEMMTKFKVAVVCRNILVVVLVAQPPFIFGGKNNPAIILGTLLVMAQASGSACCTVLQRFLRDRSVESLLLQGYLWNVLYWLPPGGSPKVRQGVVWPQTSYDELNPFGEPRIKWIGLCAGALCGGLVYIFIGYGLRYMDAAAFFFMVTPLNLGLAALVNCLVFGDPLGRLKVIALTIIAIGFFFDQWYENYASNAAAEQVEETA